MRRKSPTWPGAAFLAAAAFAAMGAGNVPGQKETDRVPAPLDQAMTVPLAYRETISPFLFRHLAVEFRTTPFPIEPAPVSNNIVRGLFKFGDDPGNAIPFLWQSGAQKLFLDLNRNQNLADDANGTFSPRVLWSAGPTFVNQLFTNVCLTFPASGAVPMRLDLHLCMDTIHHPGQALADAELRSYWQGKVTVGGHDWQVGLIQNLSDHPGSFRHGQLLLRPWQEQDRTFTAASEKMNDTLALPWEGQNQVARASDAFAFSPAVFFEGRAWRLDWSTEPRSRDETLALQFSEPPSKLGELRISGSFIHRLVLMGGPYVVVLADPPANLKIPTGQYYPYRVRLKQGDAEAYFNYGVPQTGMANVMEAITGAKLPVVSPPPLERCVVVSELQPATLIVGGPLTNCVTAAHRGRNLQLSYRLIGADSGTYWLMRFPNCKAPKFTVTAAGKNIGSGEFEFG